MIAAVRCYIQEWYPLYHSSSHYGCSHYIPKLVLLQPYHQQSELENSNFKALLNPFEQENYFHRFYPSRSNPKNFDPSRSWFPCLNLAPFWKVFLLASFGEIAVLYWVFQLLFARPRSHKHWIWRRSRVEAGGRIHKRKHWNSPVKFQVCWLLSSEKAGVVQLCMGHSPSSLHFRWISLTLDLVFFGKTHLRVTWCCKWGAQVTVVAAYPNEFFDVILGVEGCFKHNEVALTFITCSQIGGKTANRLLLQ